MTRINPPARFTSLKEEKYWSLEFSAEKFPNDNFRFYVLRKVAPDSYESHGWESEPGEAFALRRELVAETGITNYFVRAKRFVKTHAYAEAPGQTEDAWRDAMNSGDDSHIAPEQRAEFDKWAARVVTERSAYARVDRDAPRWSNR